MYRNPAREPPKNRGTLWRLPGFTGTLCCISPNRHAFSCQWATLFGSISENIQSKRGCVYFTPRHLIGDLRISPTRLRNVKTVPVCPKLKTAVWGGQERQHHASSRLETADRRLGHVHQMWLLPPIVKPQLFTPKGLQGNGGVLFSTRKLTIFFPTQPKHKSLL